MGELDIIKTIEIEESLTDPYLSYLEESLLAKKRVSFSILGRKAEDALLMSSYNLAIDAVLAGLTEAQVEHIANHGPKHYKESLLKGFSSQETFASVMQLAKSMDEDMESGDANQKRVLNNIRYLKDNRAVFQF